MMRLIFISTLLFIAMTASSQDVRMHNINDHITEINPALLLSPSGITQLGFGYRQALNLSNSRSIPARSNISPNRISSIYVRRTFDLNKVDALSMEVRVRDDNPKDGLVARTDAMMSFSFSKLLGNRGQSYQKLSIGTSLGIRLARLTNTDLWFGSQYDILNERVDIGIPSGEVNLNQLSNQTGLDLSLGLAWLSHVDGFGDYYVSMSAIHLNPYNQALYQGSNLPIERRYTALVGMRKIVNSKAMWVNTVILEQQNVFTSLSLRSTAQYDIDDDTSVALGVMPIWRDSSEGIQFNSLNIFTAFYVGYMQLSISYDIGFGAISSVTDGRGSLEFGVTYAFGQSEPLNNKLRYLY